MKEYLGVAKVYVIFSGVSDSFAGWVAVALYLFLKPSILATKAHHWFEEFQEARRWSFCFTCWAPGRSQNGGCDWLRSVNLTCWAVPFIIICFGRVLLNNPIYTIILNFVYHTFVLWSSWCPSPSKWGSVTSWLNWSCKRKHGMLGPIWMWCLFCRDLVVFVFII